MDYIALFDKLYGNDHLKATLSADLAAGRLAHAYLIEGAVGSGRHMLVNILLSALINSPLLHKKVLEGNCPDLHVVETDKGKRFIGIDKIRAIRQIAPIKPNDLDFHVFIINNAQNMTVQAQNALLKLLEEPPAAAYFFLICESASSLLSTVRSRAPILRMQSFSPNVLGEYLIANTEEGRRLHQNDPQAFDALLHLSGGTIGGALAKLAIKNDKGSETAGTVLSFWKAVAYQQTKEIYLLAAALPSDREKIGAFLSDARLALRDLAAARQGADYESLFGYRTEIEAIAGRISIERILRLDMLLVNLMRENSASANLNNLKVALADGCRKALS